MLTSPEGEEFTYALRFEFVTTNNEAEYEALIAGLRLAIELEAKNILANVDSQLVANQVSGTYEAKAVMKQYLEKKKRANPKIQSVRDRTCKEKQEHHCGCLKQIGIHDVCKSKKESHGRNPKRKSDSRKRSVGRRGRRRQLDEANRRIHNPMDASNRPARSTKG